jgi:arginine repressor
MQPSNEKPKRKWVAVYEATNTETAQIIAGRLLDEGIEAVVEGYTSVVFGASPGLANPIRVLVDADQEQEALDILSDDDDEGEDDEGDSNEQ